MHEFLPVNLCAAVINHHQKTVQRGRCGHMSELAEIVSIVNTTGSLMAYAPLVTPTQKTDKNGVHYTHYKAQRKNDQGRVSYEL